MLASPKARYVIKKTFYCVVNGTLYQIRVLDRKKIGVYYDLRLAELGKPYPLGTVYEKEGSR